MLEEWSKGGERTCRQGPGQNWEQEWDCICRQEQETCCSQEDCRQEGQEPRDLDVVECKLGYPEVEDIVTSMG